MRTYVICATVLVGLMSLVHGLPVGQTLVDQELHIGLQPDDSGTDYVREKRTVGVLRDLFPNFSQYVDRAIQTVTRLLFRVIGRVVLQGGGGGLLGGGGGGGGAGGGGGESRISITLPTYPPLPDDEDETSTEDSPGSTDRQDAGDETTQATTSPPTNDQENSVAESQLNPVRAKREAAQETEAEAEEEEEEEEDLDEQATGDNNEVAEENEADEADPENEDASSEDDPRNKRFLNFNLAGGASAGSTAGSGNFIFDVIRRSADRAARMAGTVYRVLAGTDDLGLPTYPPLVQDDASAAANATIPLIAGSGTTEEQDEAANSPVDGKADYGVGVPGPLTRLFVIANRGVANLIQDLILQDRNTQIYFNVHIEEGKYA